jgi:alpha-L-rhamnosidase
MCGIRVDGENHFIIAPNPGGSFTHAKASYQSIYGLVESGWEKIETGYRFEVRIPDNTTATVYLPDGNSQEVTAGEYCFYSPAVSVRGHGCAASPISAEKPRD